MHLDFFEYLLVFLVAGLACVFFFSRIGLGPIVGYLVAGLAIGPFALGFVHEQETLKEVSELGIVLFLFLIGLEISPSKVWRMRRAVFALGPLQIFVTAIAIAGLSFIWIDTWAQALVLGFSLALSSTAVGIQILMDRKELTSPEGQQSLGILIFQDLAVIPLLAALPFLSLTAASDAPFHFTWMSVLKPVFAVVIVVVGGLFVIPLILRFLARAHRHELFVAATLALVIGAALLMRSMGLSMALGAFLAGVLLANSEFRHELQADIEPFKALLFGLFFISLGASLDLNYLINNAGFLILAALGLLAFKSTTNFLALYAGQVCSRFRAARIASLLSQGGEFGLVVFGIATGLGILNAEISTFCVGMVGLSMAISPLWHRGSLALIHRLESNKLLPKEFDVQSQNPQVIIAGYGRVGQIVHRVLRLHQIPVTILEANHEQVEFTKKFGNKVFYGDPTRLDLLRVAGADTAKLIVLAIDQPAASVKAAEMIRKHFPNLPIYARTRNREHSLRMISIGIPQTHLFRETFYSSLELTKDILQGMGMSFNLASQTIESFVEHDKELLAGQVQYLDNEEEMIQFTTKSAEALEKLFKSDRKEVNPLA